MPGTAIFDMDRTLTKSGTWSRYMFQVNAGRPAFYLRLPLLAVHAIAYKLGFFSRRSVKEHGLKTLTWASEEALKRAAEAFAEEEVRSGLRRKAGRRSAMKCSKSSALEQPAGGDHTPQLL
ncbi:MAG: haloacid dehalogenase-like hydrolase [Pseudomonadota bacterium]|nr:haloacid dehalogenase-like hydrolase [Pseudomonadota bacterium]